MPVGGATGDIAAMARQTAAMDADDLRRGVSSALGPLAAVRAAWLFGSRNADRARPESDLDVAVAYEPTLSLDEREALRRQIVVALSDTLGLVGERADVVDLRDCDPAVGFAAISEGTLVLERDVDERCAIVSYVARRYFDDEPRRRLFRAAAVHHSVAAASRSREHRGSADAPPSRAPREPRGARRAP